ncbi:SDR family oxidoreductase [Nonomuraea sp. NPDC046802]|uniref:SDR family NAD(P)-dependent oxidoreductase n=1 Tax=Nonomuraea sp. NPDC046802 TaxID=3154919 RepID=UPI0033D82C43
MRFAEKVVIVTGAAGGIGSSVCARFADEGARVIAADREFPADRSGARHVVEDLSTPGAGQRIVDAALQAHGRVDVVVANAGRATDGDLDEVDDVDLRQDLTINLSANFGLFRAAIRAMREQGSGAFVAISSVNAHEYYGSPAYSAAKAGLEALIRSVAARHGIDGIRANSVVLGTIATPAWKDRLAREPGMLEQLRELFPLRRIGTPADVAALVAFVASEEASWMTGASIVLDGGMRIANPQFTTAVFGSQQA